MWLTALIVLFLGFVLVEGMSSADGNGSSNNNDPYREEDEYEDMVAADECDRYWDPPGDNI